MFVTVYGPCRKVQAIMGRYEKGAALSNEVCVLREAIPRLGLPGKWCNIRDSAEFIGVPKPKAL